MDLNYNTIPTSSSSSWDLVDMTMGLPNSEQLLLLDHLPMDHLFQPTKATQPLSMPFHQQPSEAELGGGREEVEDEGEEKLGAMKEMMYKITAMQPVDVDPDAIKKPTRRNVRISNDPQSVAARHRRERISERIRILQRLVPGGAKMDTASMLDEAIRYLKFLKRQVRRLQSMENQLPSGQLRSSPPATSSTWPAGFPGSGQSMAAVTFTP